MVFPANPVARFDRLVTIEKAGAMLAADKAKLDGYPAGTALLVANLLTNGGFEAICWQRGVGPFTATGAYTSDRWQLALNTSTASVSRIASTVGSNGYSLQLAYTHAAAGNAIIFQKPEDFTQLQNKTLTFSVTVKSTVAGTVRLYLYNGTANTYSAYNVGTGAERLSVTATVAAARDANTDGHCSRCSLCHD